MSNPRHILGWVLFHSEQEQLKTIYLYIPGQGYKIINVDSDMDKQNI